MRSAFDLTLVSIFFVFYVISLRQSGGLAVCTRALGDGYLKLRELRCTLVHIQYNPMYDLNATFANITKCGAVREFLTVHLVHASCAWWTQILVQYRQQNASFVST